MMPTVKYLQLAESIEALRLLAKEVLPIEIANTAALVRRQLFPALAALQAGTDDIINQYGTPNEYGEKTLVPGRTNWTVASALLKTLRDTEVSMEVALSRADLDKLFRDDPPAGYSEILYALDWLLSDEKLVAVGNGTKPRRRAHVKR